MRVKVMICLLKTDDMLNVSQEDLPSVGIRMLLQRSLTLAAAATCALMLASAHALSQPVPASTRAAGEALLQVCTRDDQARAERHGEDLLRDERLHDERLNDERLRDERRRR